MKRKGRKSNSLAKAEKSLNGSSEVDHLSDTTTQDEMEPEVKKPVNKRKSNQKKKVEETEEQYEVEQVLDQKMIRGIRHYLIRWKGYEPESDTWEPESTLNCAKLIADYEATKKRRGRKKKKASIPGTDETWDENENFEVDRILDVYFKKNGSREFLVSWRGYPTSQNTWEPEENMDCKDLIKKFMDKVKKAQEVDQRELRVNRTPTNRLTLLSDGHLGRRLSKRNLGKQRVHYHETE